MMRQVDLITMKPLPPPPPPEDNTITITETVTMVEEYYDEDDMLHERPTKEITIKTWYCEYAEFDSRGFCHGCSGEPTYGDKITCASTEKHSATLTKGDQE